MNRPKVLLWLALATSACGGGGGSNSSSSQESAAPSTHAPDQEIELTDKLMEDYVAILKEMKGTKDANPLTFLARHGWTLERWSTVAGTVAMGMSSAGRAVYADAAGKSIQELDAQVTELEARLPKASAEQRPILQQQLDGLRQARASLAESVQPVSDQDRRSNAVLQRWLPKIQELDAAQ